MLIAMMVQAGVAEAAAFDHPWLTISRSVTLTRAGEEVAFVSVTDGQGAEARRYDRIRVIRRTWRDRHAVQTKTYTDSLACVAAARLVAAIGSLPMPHAMSPDTPADIVFDGVDYRVTVTAGYGQLPQPITFESNVHTSLADWVDANLDALEPCLSPE